MTKWLADREDDLPLAADRERAGVGLERWLTAAAAAQPPLLERARAQAGETAASVACSMPSSATAPT